MDAGSPERAWRQQDASAFPQLLEAVAEFLQFHGLSKAAAALHEERLGSPDLRRPLAGTEGASRIKADLVRACRRLRHGVNALRLLIYVGLQPLC